MTQKDIIAELGLYGIDVNKYQLEGLTDEQLLLILQALRVMRDRLLQLAKTCGTRQDQLTSQELTNLILTQPIQVRFDNKSNESSKVDEISIPGTQILIFDQSVFFNRSEESYSPEISQRIIIHEFGHIFHNVMNEQIDEGTMIYTRTVDGQQMTLNILPNTPEGIIGYIETVGAFYYTNERDFNYPLNETVSSKAIDLTSLNFRGAGKEIEELYISGTNIFTDEARRIFDNTILQFKQIMVVNLCIWSVMESTVVHQ